jgi:hypothetical protein
MAVVALLRRWIAGPRRLPATGHGRASAVDHPGAVA